MSIFRMLQVNRQIQPQSAESPAASGTGGQNIRLERTEDLDMVLAFVALLRDETEATREIIQDMSPKDRALLSFILGEMSRVVSEEEQFRVTEDRRAARAAVLGDI